MNWVDRHWAGQEVEVRIMESNLDGSNVERRWYLGTVNSCGAASVAVDVPGIGGVCISHAQRIQLLAPVFEADPHDVEAVETWLNSVTA